MALFVLVLVGLVVGQTWLDWRETRKDWVIPEWAKGMALAGRRCHLAHGRYVVRLCVASGDAGQWTSGFGSRFFWAEPVFLFVVLGMIVVAARKKHLRWLLIVASVITAAAFWFGMSLFS